MNALASYHAMKVPEEKHEIYYSKELLLNPLRKRYKEKIDRFCKFLKVGSSKINSKKEKFHSNNAWNIFNRYERPDFFGLINYCLSGVSGIFI